MGQGDARSKSPSGFRRISAAFRYTCSGFRQAVRHEAAIREELIALAFLVPLSIWIHVGAMEHLVLLLTLLLVVLVEFLNSAIEATVDRISLERHPLAGRAKDFGSAAVFVALVMCALSWAVVCGPLIVRSLK